MEFLETRHVVAEADLAIAERAFVAAAILVVDWKKRQADAGLTGCCCDALRHLREIVVGSAIGLMVQIVKLHIGGVACFQHFHLHQRGNRLDMIGRQPVEEAVHQLPPGPERVRSIGPPHLGQARHGALEGMAVGVGECGQENAGAVGTGWLRLICGE